MRTSLSSLLICTLASCAPLAEGGGVGPPEPTPRVDGVDGDDGGGDDGGGVVGSPPGEGEGEAEAGDGSSREERTCGGGVGGCTADGADLRCELEHDGRTRRYLLHLPAAAAGTPTAPVPLVVALHGLRTTARLQKNISRMNESADENGYVVVYPEGVGPQTSQSWNAGVCCGAASSDDVDDVGFVRALVAQLSESLCVDERRVYATGLSNGGHMAYRLACDASDLVAAVAPVAGVVTTLPCTPAAPVPVLAFHGTADTIVPYNLGINGTNGAAASVDRFAVDNGCGTATTVTYEEGEATCRRRTGCDGADVELCTIAGGGHQWPGGVDLPLLGHNTRDIDATTYIWEFFSSHPKP